MTEIKHRRNAWIILIILFLSLLLRKAGFGFSTFLINASVLILCIYVIRYPVFFARKSIRFITVLFVLICTAILHYWIPPIPVKINELKEISIISFFMMGWLIFSFINFREIINNSLTLVLWLFLSLILSSNIYLNPREFHNFYRHRTYEEYIRSKYSIYRGIVADYFIDKYKITEKDKAKNYFDEAIKEEENGDYEKALDLYNKSIEYNPDDKFAYHRRGYLKLTKLEINEDVALSAFKDFDRAIRLDTNFTIAYFHRGITYGYLNNKNYGYMDFRRVWLADSILSDSVFQKRYGVSKETFSKPFHP
jgi:tetratricopeptide (TPR) repeat protein